MSKVERIRWISPPGIARFPHLDEPRAFKSKSGKPGDPKYSTDVVLEGKVLSTAKKEVEALVKPLVADMDNPKLPFGKDKKDKKVEFFKCHTGEKYRPAIFDSKNRKLPEGVIVGPGSIIRVDVSFERYDEFGGGVTAYLNAVQVIKLEEGMSGKSRFDEAEGYEYEGEDEENASPFKPDASADMYQF